MTRRGDTLLFDAPPTVAAWAAAGGKKESEGPLASAFDFVTQDAAFGEQGCENWEQAESLLQRKAVELCLRKADIPRSKVDIAFAGDLQAQCTASNYTMRELGIPFAGIYGACSTMAETLGLAAVFAAGGMAERVLAMTSSHFCAAERQFRTPLEYGAKRTPTAQWTATAAGACLVRAHGSAGVPVLSVTFGRVQDFAVHDINNMGAAMMPAAASTLLRYFSATGNILYLVAACVFCFSVWRINRLHTPVALVCEKKLLVSVPWSFLNSDFDFSFKSLYMPIEYSEITGVSNCWDHLYIGARVAGGIVGLPVQMSCVSRKDKKKFKFWISKKQEENRHVSRLTF